MLLINNTYTEKKVIMMLTIEEKQAFVKICALVESDCDEEQFIKELLKIFEDMEKAPRK